MPVFGVYDLLMGCTVSNNKVDKPEITLLRGMGLGFFFRVEIFDK